MRFILKLIVLLSLIVSFSYADESGDVTKLTATIREFGSPNKDDIWPGFDLRRMPTVIHFKNGHAYAFHFRQLSKQWKRGKIEGYPIFFSKKQSTLTQIPLHPSYDIEGIPTFVYSMDHAGSSDFSLLTFVHERFHLHQFRFFKNLNETKGDYLDHHNLENLAMMELELRILTQFLLSDTSESKESYLKDFVAVSTLRRGTLQLSSLQWEDHQERMEGMADYVSLKTYEVFDILENFKSEKKLLEMRAKKTSSSLYQDTTRGRNYFVGAVIGFALDFCHVGDWKSSVSKGTKSLNQLLVEVLPVTLDEQQIRLAHAMEEFDYKTIKETLRDKLKTEEDNLKAMQQSFEKEEGIAVCISLPQQHSSSGGRHTKSYHFDRLKVFLEETSTAISQDQRWKLTFDAVPIVFEENNGSRTFKMDRDTVLTVDGREVPLSEIDEPLYFSSLSLKSSYSKLETTLSGCIYPINGYIKIDF